ncbi:MAG: hypothetical protein WD825_04995 [Gemmatimonadaceae bacterium]
MILLRRLVVLSAFCLPATLQGQKPALAQADWDRWRSISGAALTNDGRWAAYSIAPLVGDGELVLRSTSGPTEYRIARGYLGRPNNVPGGLRPRAANPEDEPAGPGVAPAQLTADSKYALVLTYPTQAEFDRVARDRRRAATVQNRADLALVRLADGNVTTIQRVRSFRLPRYSGAWVAYVVADSAPADSSARPAGGGAPAAPAARPATPRRRFGTALVLRNLATGGEERIADVLDFAFDDSAKVFAYAVVSRASDKDGAYVRNLSTGATTTLLSGKGDYTQIALDRAASQIAFVSNRDEFGKDNATFTLYHASIREGVAKPAVTASALSGRRLVEGANVAFTRAGNAIVLGIAPPLVDTLPADSLVNKSVFDLWHYKDATLQPAQRLSAARDRNRSFQAIYHVATKKLVRLANDSMPQVSISDDGRIALANTRERYMIEQMWGDGGTDVYVIDAVTGTAKLVREKITGNAQLSTNAKYAAFFDNGKWFTYNVATGRTTEVTAAVKGVSFARETHDTPSPAPAWGIAGWTKDDRSMLVYDRWDIWEIDPTGVRAPVMVTDSMGRKGGVTLRLAMGGGGFGFGGHGMKG